MRASIRGTEIYFDVAGMELIPSHQDCQKRAVVFMLHGGPGADHVRYKQHSLAIQDVAQLIFIDNRGCGLSKKSSIDEYSLENNIEDIEALRQHLGLDKICLLGTSYGGVVAQGYAIRYPNNLDKLVLVATAPSFRFIEEAKQTLEQKGDLEQIAMAKHLWEGTFTSPEHAGEFFNVMAPLYSVNPSNELPKLCTTWSYEALNIGFSHFLREFDFISELKQVACPTLVLAGQEDWICSPGQSKIIKDHIPNAELCIFPNCSHMIAIDAHEQYIEKIKAFLLCS